MSPDDCTIEGISAVTFYVADMARALDFYHALGFAEVYGGPSSRFTSLRAGSGYLNLILGQPPATHWGRIILYVSDVDAMYRRALQAGFSPQAQPADASWGERYFHLSDPDNNELSFARPLGR
jgi:catechol 2,3-dioxygenase-like lactoylglutathione lyase family enzyme